MDFANDIDERFAHMRLSLQDQQNRDEAKRLQDDVLRAIERLERQSLPVAIAGPVRPSVFDRADVSELISNLHLSPTPSPFSSWKVLGIRVIVGVVASAFAIGVVFIAANTGRLALPDVPVIHSLPWLAGAPSDSGAEETVPTGVQHAITAPTAATLPAQIPTVAESNGGPSDQVSAPAGTAPSNVASTAPTELAQPSTAITEHEPISSSKDDKTASLPIDPNVSAPTPPQQNVPSPATTIQDDAALFRQFFESRTNQAKPQLGQKRQSHFSRRAKGLHVLRSNGGSVSDAAITTTNSSLRTQRRPGRHDPSNRS
jgi:hypothetical protein